MFSITPEAKLRVRDALRTSADLEEVIVSAHKIDMTRRNFLCLRPNEWLNDLVIDFYLIMVKARFASDSKAPPQRGQEASATPMSACSSRLPRLHIAPAQVRGHLATERAHEDRRRAEKLPDRIHREAAKGDQRAGED